MNERFRQPIWLIPLSIAGLVALVGWYGDTRLRHRIEEELKDDLTTTLNANVTALTIWMTNQTRLAAFMAEEPEIRKLSVAILEQSPRPGIERGRPPDSPEQEMFSSYLRPRLRTVSYDAAQLVNTNFVVAANCGPGRMRLAGTSVSEAQTNKLAELFSSGQPFIITPYKPTMPSRPRRPREGAPDRGPFGPPSDELGDPVRVLVRAPASARRGGAAAGILP